MRHATRVQRDPATGMLGFSCDDYFDDYAFQGVASPQELTGGFDDDFQTHTLPRVSNSWLEQPPCQVPGYDPSPEFPE